MVKNNNLSIEQHIIDKVGKIAKQWGLGEPSGRVLASFLFEDKPLSQKDIAVKTSYSLSLVSPTLKILENLGFVSKERAGSKEKFYELKISFVDIFDRMIKKFVKQDISPLISELEGVRSNKLNGNKRIIKLIDDFRRVENFLVLFDKTCKVV